MHFDQVLAMPDVNPDDATDLAVARNALRYGFGEVDGGNQTEEAWSAMLEVPVLDYVKGYRLSARRQAERLAKQATQERIDAERAATPTAPASGESSRPGTRRNPRHPHATHLPQEATLWVSKTAGAVAYSKLTKGHLIANNSYHRSLITAAHGTIESSQLAIKANDLILEKLAGVPEDALLIENGIDYATEGPAERMD